MNFDQITFVLTELGGGREVERKKKRSAPLEQQSSLVIVNGLLGCFSGAMVDGGGCAIPVTPSLP